MEQHVMCCCKMVYWPDVCTYLGEKLDYKACESLEEILKRVQFKVIDLEQTNLDEDVRRSCILKSISVSILSFISLSAALDSCLSLFLTLCHRCFCIQSHSDPLSLLMRWRDVEFFVMGFLITPDVHLCKHH